MLITVASKVGAYLMHMCERLGFFSLFFARIIYTLFTTKCNLSKVYTQIERIGVESFNIVALTGTFTGMVFALQSYIGFQRVGGEQFIGAVVALAMVRELAPVLTGLMVTGRV